MKRNLLCLCALLCALNFLTSCDDDDNQPGVYKNDSLKIVMSGNTVTNSELKIDGTTAIFKKLLPGEGELAIPVTLTANGFSGTAKNDTREVAVDAKILNGVADVTVTLTQTNVLAGNEYFTNAQSLSLDFATQKETITFGGKNYPSAVLPQLVGVAGGPMLAGKLKSVRFGTDGNITGSIVQGDAVNLIPAGYAMYNIVDGKLFVSLNVEAIFSKSSLNPLEPVLSMLNNGIPLALTTNGNKASFTISREVLAPVASTLPYLFPLLVKLGIISGDLAALESTVDEVSTIIMESTKFDLSLNLEKK